MKNQMKQTRVILAAAAALSLSLSGCAVKGSLTQRIDIESSTEGSRIAVYDKNNYKILESSASVTADLLIGNQNSGGVYLVEITKEGYEPLTAQIGPDFDVRGGFFWGSSWTLGNLSPRIINADLESGTITVFNRSDWYFTRNYGIPLGGMPQWGYIYAENGRIWRNGAFCGTDFDFGIGYDDKKSERYKLLAGYGFDAGVVYDLPIEEDLKLVYGGAVGFWFTSDYNDYNGEYNFNFLAPFVKLRWKSSLELSYRGLLGVGLKVKRYEYYDRYNGGYDYEYKTDSKFGWNNHQLALGVYYEGSKRKGVKRFDKNIYKSIDNN